MILNKKKGNKEKRMMVMNIKKKEKTLNKKMNQEVMKMKKKGKRKNYQMKLNKKINSKI